MPEYAAYIAIAALIWYAALGIGHGIKKIGHGAKVVACKMHVAHCKDSKETK